MDVSAATKNTDYDHLTLETIKQLAAQETPPSERPDTLLLKNIRTAPSVFQRRRPGRYEEERVVSDIIRDLKAGPPRLPGPILVTAVGRHFFVVDGHHRLLDADPAVTWKHPIPVKHFTGPLKDAWRQSLRSNVLNKIHMSQEEKSEALGISIRTLRASVTPSGASLGRRLPTTRTLISAQWGVWRRL